MAAWWRRLRVPWYGMLLVCVFASQLLTAVLLHLDTSVARRSLAGWVSRYLSSKLRGTVDLGQLESLSATRFVLRNAVIYDAQHRRVATINRLFAESNLLGALYRTLTKNEPLTLIVESVRADGVHLRLHPAQAGASTSLLAALEPVPEPNAASSPVQPYRIFLANVEIGDTAVDSTLDGFVTSSLQLQRVGGQVLFTHRGVAASVKRFNLKLRDAEKGPIQAFGGLEFRSPDRLWGDVNAVLGAVSCALHLDYRAATLDLQIHPFKITPSAARQWLPAWPLQPTLVASLSARGPLNELGVRWNLHAETAEIEGVGRLNVVGGMRADLAILAHSLDLRSLFGIPLPSSFDAALRLSLALQDSQPMLQFDGVIHPGYVAGIVTPRIDIDGQLDAEGLLVAGRSNDPRLPVRAAVMLRGKRLDINAQLDHGHLEHLLPAGSALAAHGQVGVRARAKVEDEAITAELDLTLKDLRVAAARVGAASLRAEFQGPLATPKQWEGSLDLSATRVSVAPGFEFARVVGAATGGPQSAQVRVIAEQPGATKVSIRSNLRALGGPSLGATSLELVRGQRTLSLSLGSVSVNERTLVLNRLHMDGSAGKADGTLALSPQHVYGQLTGNSIDLTALSEMLGLPLGLVSGTAAFDFDLDTRRSPAGGLVRVEFDRTSLGPLQQITGQLELGLTGHQLKVSSRLSSRLIEQLDAQADVTLDGPPTQLRSYRRSTGSATVDLARLHLDRALEAFGHETLISSIAGTANVRLSVNRTTRTEQPSWTLSAVTNDFGATLNREGVPIRIAGLDWLFSADFRGDSSRLRSDVVLYRDNQPRLSLNAAARMPPVSEWLDAYRSGFDWRDVPVEAFLSVPHQPLANWRDAVGFELGKGTAEAKLWLKGPVRSMHLAAEVRGNDLLLQALGNTTPISIEALFEHGPNQTRLLGSAGSGQTTWLQLNAIGQLVPCLERLLCITDWTGQAELGLLGLPLGNVPRLGELGIRGELRGALSTRREAGLTRVNGVLPVTNLRMSGQALGQAVLHVLSDETELIAGAKLLDANAQINLEVHVPMRWNGALPALHEVAPIRVVAAATGYDAAVLRPWMDETVGDLGGELSGRLDATIEPQGPTQAGDNGSTIRQPSDGPQVAVSGYVTLNHGRGTLRSVGLGFTDVAIAAQVASTGARTTISVPTISASSGSLQNNLNASAVVELENLSLKRLTARLGRAKDIPLPLNSTSFATLSGAADLEVTRGVSGFDVYVDFQDLELHLLRNSTRQVVGLTENPDISVLQPLGPDDWQKARDRAPTEFHVRVSLGGRARVKRADFNIPVTGVPEVIIGSRLRPSGTIYLGSTGRLELLGKSFVIDRGQVTLDPDHPSNPQFDITATWRGPTHLVTAQLRGTPEDARLRLSSDPPLPSEARVMALLMGGGSGNDSTAGAGLGVGATLFNELLSDTALSSLEVRTSSGDQHANYTAAVPLRENLWFEATYQSPTNSTLPGTSVQRGFSGTVDYRFRRNWSVRTELGTLGAGADLLWQYRY